MTKKMLSVLSICNIENVLPIPAVCNSEMCCLKDRQTTCKKVLSKKTDNM